MSRFSLFLVFLFGATTVFAAPLNLTGIVKDESDASIKDAVVLLKVNDNLIAYARTLSKADGSFELLPGRDAPGEITGETPIETQRILQTNYAYFTALDLKGRTHNSLNNLPQGIYVLLGKTEKGNVVKIGTVYHKGGALAVPQTINFKPQAFAKSVIISNGDNVQLIVRKAGYLPKEVPFSSFSENVGTVVLERDPLEDRIDSVMALMNLDDKIYQMTQPLVSAGYGNGTYLFGSVLHGGDDYSGTVLSSMNTALNSYNPKIPVTYGKDMMHGAAAISGATIFPHNIGMGATRDSALVRRACEVTARESWAGNVDLIFGPAISVPQDARWGRTYEGFGETPELAVMMGAACVRGYQGDKYNADWRVIATAKHYLADGGTAYGTGVNGGMDRGNVTANDETIRAIHLPGYEAVIEQGVLSIMASFNQIREIHQHVDSLRLTGWLKTELGFDGYIISDWLGIGNSELPGTSNGYSGQTATTSQNAIRKAINAGIDLAMEPGTQSSFISGLKTLVSNNSVSTDRINDAVRRILRAKFRAGRMDNPAGISTFVKNKYGDIGNSEHRNVAREAVRKSLVLLKNENSALPISKTAKVFVTGSHADVPSYQCGGWTLGWQGALNTNWQTGAVTGPKTVPGATSIQSGIYNVATRANSASEADVIIYVTGEQPYAEWHGDISSLELTDNTLASLRSGNSGKKIVTIFISGRPREVNSMISNSDAFVAAWLPGSEGAGVADVLFGDYKPTGKLPMKWPGTPNYPYGFGLTYP